MREHPATPSPLGGATVPDAYLRHWMTQHKGPWHPIVDGPNLMARLPRQAHYCTILAYQPGPDNLPARYRGPFYAEWDAQDPAAVLAELRTCLQVLQVEYDVPLDGLRLSHSGGRGYHLTLPPVVLGATEGHPQLPRIYRTIDYAHRLGKDDKYLGELRHAAEVFRTITAETSGLSPKFLDKAKHLAALHKAPPDTWSALASQLLLATWSVEEVEAAVKRVTELLNAIPTWWTALDRPGLAALAAQGQTKERLPMFRLAAKLVAEFEPVTVYHHEETDQVMEPGAGGAQLLQHQADHFGPAGLGDLIDRDGPGRGVPAMVHIPAQHPIGARAGGIDAFGRPGHPVAAVGQREEGEELAAVVPAVPAERAVGVCQGGYSPGR